MTEQKGKSYLRRMTADARRWRYFKAALCANDERLAQIGERLIAELEAKQPPLLERARMIDAAMDAYCTRRDLPVRKAPKS